MTKEILKMTKEYTKGKWWKFFGIFLLIFVLISGITTSFLISDLVIYRVFGKKVFLIALIPLVLLGIYIYSSIAIGANKYFYESVNNNEKIKYLFYGFTHFKLTMKYILAGLVICLASAVYDLIAGFIARLTLKIPGVAKMVIPVLNVSTVPFLVYMIFTLIFAILFIYVSLFMYPLLDGKGSMKSIGRSFTLVKGHLWSMLWLPIRLYLIPIILDICGVLILFFASYELYKQALIFEAVKLASYSSVIKNVLFMGLGSLCMIVAFIIKIILIPRRFTLLPSAYKKLNNEKELTED